MIAPRQLTHVNDVSQLSHFFKRLVDVAHSSGGDFHESEDDAQNTYLQLMEHIRRGKRLPILGSGWRLLQQINLNVRRDRIRKGSRFPSAQALPLEGEHPLRRTPGTSPDSSLLAREAIQLISDRFGEQNLEILRLMLEGMASSDIAERFAISAKAVECRLDRMESALAELLN